MFSMCKRSPAFALLLSVALTGVGWAGADQRGRNQGQPPPAELRAEGTITAIGPASVTIMTRANNVVTVVVVAATRIERNGLDVGLAALKVGDRAEARFSSATGVASRIQAVGP